MPQTLGHLLFGDQVAMDLAVHVTADRLDRLFELVLGDVVQKHLIAAKRADMSDAVAHLAGADDTNGLYVHGFASTRMAFHTQPGLRLPPCAPGSPSAIRGLTSLASATAVILQCSILAAWVLRRG